MDSSGSIAPRVLMMLLILAAALMGVSGYLEVSRSSVRRSADREARKTRLYTEAMTVVARLSDDPTPESDWAGDPVQEYCTTREHDGIRVKITDISSRLNLNYIRKNLLEKTAFSSLLKPGVTAAELQQFRVDSGLSPTLEPYMAFFRESARPYCTTYGWANINLTDEFVLRSLYASLSGSAYGAQAFHTRIQSLLTEKRILLDEEYATYLGEDAARVFPVINTEPWFNIHFVDPYILGELVAYPEYAIENPARKTARLLELRRYAEMSRADIAAALGVSERHTLLQYIGTTTAFWDVTATLQDERCTLIVARLPYNPTDFSHGLHAQPQFRVIERRFEP